MILCLAKGTSPVSKAIQWQTRSPYSHAFLLFRHAIVIEAKEFVGVRKRFWGREDTPITDKFDFDYTPAQEDIVYDFLTSQLGKPYDYSSIARFLTRRVDEEHRYDDWFCSEIVTFATNKAKIYFLDPTIIKPEDVSPGDLGKSPIKRPHLRPC